MTGFDRSDSGSRDRFFHSMVVMGSTIALGCGGISVDDSSPRPDEDAVRASAGTGGSGGSAMSTAGSGGTSTAGSGFAGISGSAGTSPAHCPDAQYTCTGFTCDNDSWSEGGRCYCDPSRPLSAADCNPGTSFVCRSTLTDRRTGAALPQPAGLDCQCITVAETCSDACEAAYPEYADGYLCYERAQVLCGCSFVFLK
jgi:hypothetical protein